MVTLRKSPFHSGFQFSYLNRKFGSFSKSLGKDKRPVIAVVFSGAQINKRQIINPIESHIWKSQCLRNGNPEAIPPCLIGVKLK